MHSSALWVSNVLSVCVPDSAKDFEQDEKFMEEMTKVLKEGRQERARHFSVAGDLNVEIRPRCTDDEEELREMYGPKCLRGIDADPEGLKRSMWLEVMKEFNCKANGSGGISVRRDVNLTSIKVGVSQQKDFETTSLRMVRFWEWQKNGVHVGGQLSDT